MNIELPPKKGSQEVINLDFKQLVIIGANGSGKTRFGSYIEQKNLKKTHRISAQKSLSFPKQVNTTSKEKAINEFLFGYYYDKSISNDFSNHKINHRWNSNTNTSLLNDYEKLLVLLHTEEYETMLDNKEGRSNNPITKLDKIQKLWEAVLPHRKLIKRAGTIETYPAGNEQEKYNASEMSDGERVLFYLAGEVICAPLNSIIIIDEPEMHIHSSLIKIFFDLVENERPDCSFIYLTHHIDFAFTRQNAKKIWMKSYEGNNHWDYEILDEESPIPEQLYLEVLGSRKPVLFIEGENSSIDYELYEQVFPDYTLKPVGSCEKVIHIVKSFQEQKNFHHIESFGIIDRDRRQSTDITKLNTNGIWVLDVAEAENLLLIEPIVKAIANHMGKNEEEIFDNVRQNILDFFKEQCDSQVLLHFKESIVKEFTRLSNFTSNEITSAVTEIDNAYSAIDKQALFNNINQEFQQIITNNDYDGSLRVFNLKNALIPKSNILNLTGIKHKNDIKNLVITLLKRKDENSQLIASAINSKIVK
ncbi:DUF4435 domain-containing protein [Apibacter sp. HY039]|uniref:DUF4435 domain-containing protein n=1 Tax=Apibacter sp. HY039 TaxID=2501476 RepID=UPI000FEBE195|nr:DUF4435 domain-containing protein [Apibacter sp. HY039]